MFSNNCCTFAENMQLPLSMTREEIQKRVNQDIEEYLNTYQVILEYARLFIDKDKKIRANYKWIKIARKGLLTGAILNFLLWIADKVIANISLETYMPVFILSLVIFVLSYIVLVYLKRNQIASLIENDEKKELVCWMNNLQLFIDQLIRWLKVVDYGQKPSIDNIVNIKGELAISLNKQLLETNRISEIQGLLDPELDKTAHEIATERLQSYIIYFYPYEER